MQKWEIDLNFRKDLYNAYKAIDLKKLDETQSRYMEKILLSFKLNGLNLSDQKQKKIKSLTQELAKLTTEFSENIKNAKANFTFKLEDLSGVPESYFHKLILHYSYIHLSNFWHNILLYKVNLHGKLSILYIFY